jgi:hypothetical protein
MVLFRLGRLFTVERKPMQKLALVLLGVMLVSAASVGAASASERPFVAPASFTAGTTFTEETTDMSLPGYLQFVLLCESLVGWWAE